MRTADMIKRRSAADVSKPPKNGEILLSYWKRIGGQFESGFLVQARAAAEKHGFFYERGRLHNTFQLTADV